METRILRCLLVLFLLGLALGCGLLYALGLESARAWPELAHLRLPVYLAALVGCVPVVLVIRSVFEFLDVVDRGAAFSVRTVEILRRVRLLVGVFAGCLALGLVGFWVVSDLMHPTLVLLWLAVELPAVFLVTLLALIERILVGALGRRQDVELPV